MKELSFGEIAVGLTFNPSGDEKVNQVKRKCADLINDLDHFRKTSESSGAKRHCSIAITFLEDAQMRAVKALTWKD